MNFLYYRTLANVLIYRAKAKQTSRAKQTCSYFICAPDHHTHGRIARLTEHEDVIKQLLREAAAPRSCNEPRIC